ncbi:MAG: hypothetical protein M3362_12625 [Acidobacteriota bacterium]|nr:hypothetical protein [Acidobacteriota bacterium]
MKKYPDISEIVKKKEKHRRTLSKLSFEEKIEMVFKLRERKKFIRSGQVVNIGQQPKRKTSNS